MAGKKLRFAGDMMVSQVPDHYNFPDEEEKILKLWKQLDAFHTSLKQSKDRPRYTFYDGPPFATGLPHYGHILAGTIKVCVLSLENFAVTCMKTSGLVSNL